MNDKYTCKICGKQFKNIGGHVIQSHKDIIESTKDYYDKYLKKDNEGICPVCGKETKFITITRGYLEHCCPKCAQNDKKVRIKQETTNLQRYNTKCSLAAPEARHKTKQTKQERYGDENYNNPQQMKRTKIEKYGEYYVNPEKTKETNLKKYSVTIASKLDSTKLKQKKTCQERYNVDSYLQTDAAKNAFKEKYNADHPMHVDSIKEKLKQTNLDRYGIECTFQVREFRLKAIHTMKKNGNNSSLEDYLENFFINNNIIYMQEYKEKRYPYFCDFYLPDNDIFIEINGYWTHNDHFFNKNNPKDIETLNEWKKLAINDNQYNSAIKVWTKDDVNKLTCARKNNLNYAVLWNKNDIETFIQNYKI